MAAAKVSVRRILTGDRSLDEAQRTAQDVGKGFNALAFARGVLIDAEPGKPAGTGLTFTAGTARSIAHGLGRKARGFLEVSGADAPSAAHVGLRATAHPAGVTSSTHVTVTPASSGVAFLFVF